MANTAKTTGKGKGSKTAAKTPNINDFLTANAGKVAPKGKKGSVPVLSSATALGDRCYRAYVEMKDAAAAFKAVEGEVLDLTNGEYEKRAKSGDFTKSFNLVGEETEGVQVVYSDKFSALPIEAEEGLREQLGEDFDTHFEQKREITLNDTSDETVALLIKKLGAETVAKLFAIKLSIVAKPDMDRRQFDLPEGVATLAGLKQNKAGVKPIKSTKK
jgi:hypothetical protein